ncbi:UNVERIFIED_CONTAM: Mediator of RNA polymerase II transcription subunit 21 [Siphonaria sp. JEL0065]|nr:Mediator of RNA polymerase II transcription subunit 21 [Siphonaria sp. JEL0065]
MPESPNEQELRSQMREDYLRFWLSIASKKPEATFHMYKNTVVSGTLSAIDATQTYCNVDNLKTPIGVYAEATLRVDDIQSIVIESKPV